MEIEELFNTPAYRKEIETLSEVNTGHGRVEERTLECIIDPMRLSDLELFQCLNKWAEVKSVFKLTRKRYNKKTGEEVTYKVSSLNNPDRVFLLIRRQLRIISIIPLLF